MDNNGKDKTKAGAETPKPAAKSKAASPRRRGRAATVAAKDKAEAKPAPAAKDSGSGTESKPKRWPIQGRTVGVGLALAIVVAAGAWFTVSAWLERPGRDAAKDRLGAQLSSLERMVEELEGKLDQAEKKLAAEAKTTLPLFQVPGQAGGELAPSPGTETASAAEPSPTEPEAAERGAAEPTPTEPEAVKRGTAEPSPTEPEAAERGAGATETPAPAPGQSAKRVTTVDDLSGRLENLEQQFKSSAAPSPSAASVPVPPMLALLGFHDAIARGAPFAAELASLERSFAGNEAVLAVLAPLAPWSGRGVATVAALQRQLEARVPAILRAARPPVDDSGPWLKRNLARSWERLRALVVIRRVGEAVPGTKPDAIIARAEAKLAKFEIAGAVAELSALQGAAAAAAQDWLAQARARLKAEAAVAAITGGLAPRPAEIPVPGGKAPATGADEGGRR